MNAVRPIEFEMPDGSKRHIRATNGARRRIVNHFGEMDIQKILAEKGDGALGEIAYLMMYDEDGKPPALSMDRFTESLTWDAGIGLLALVLSAFSQGQTSPNEMEAMLKAVATPNLETQTNTLPSSTVSPTPASESPESSSGTDSSPAKLTLLAAPTEIKSEAEPS